MGAYYDPVDFELDILTLDDEVSVLSSNEKSKVRVIRACSHGSRTLSPRIRVMITITRSSSNNLV